jgi:hypothetical protein
METFNEKQNFFKHWWFVFLPSLFVPIAISVGIGTQKDTPLIYILIPILIALFVVGIISLMGMQTIIDEKRIQIDFKLPFVKKKEILWEDIKEAKVKQFEPLSEYGGWGYRKRWRKDRVAYNVYGVTGLEVTLNNDHIIMIGTQRGDQLNAYLIYLKNKYGINVTA